MTHWRIGCIRSIGAIRSRSDVRSNTGFTALGLCKNGDGDGEAVAAARAASVGGGGGGPAAAAINGVIHTAGGSIEDFDKREEGYMWRLPVSRSPGLPISPVPDDDIIWTLFSFLGRIDHSAISPSLRLSVSPSPGLPVSRYPAVYITLLDHSC